MIVFLSRDVWPLSVTQIRARHDGRVSTKRLSLNSNVTYELSTQPSVCPHAPLKSFSTAAAVSFVCLGMLGANTSSLPADGDANLIFTGGWI